VRQRPAAHVSTFVIGCLDHSRPVGRVAPCYASTRREVPTLPRLERFIAPFEDPTGLHCHICSFEAAACNDPASIGIGVEC
jgi:hypothetical protein